MAEFSKCPVCGWDTKAAYGVTNRDMSWVECLVCGRYKITDEAAMYVAGREFEGRKHLLSGVLRRAAEAETFLEVTTYTADDLVQQAPRRRGMLDVLDDALIYIYERARALERVDESVRLQRSDYSLLFLHDFKELMHLVGELERLERVIQNRSQNEIRVQLTIPGWERAEQLHAVRGRPDQAFVAMWFNKSLDGIWREGFYAGLDGVGYKPIRIDAVHHSEGVDDRILAEIRQSGLMVADFTGQRHGVYFEAGFAMGLGIPIVWCCRQDEVDRLHFDTRQYPHILWESVDDLRTKLQDRVRGLGYARR